MAAALVLIEGAEARGEMLDQWRAELKRFLIANPDILGHGPDVPAALVVKDAVEQSYLYMVLAVREAGDVDEAMSEGGMA